MLPRAGAFRANRSASPSTRPSSRSAAVVVVALLMGTLALAALPAPARAHTPAEPLPIEVKVLQDEGEDAFYWYDGYDLWYLLVREAYLPDQGREGLVFRFQLYGGFAPGSTADRMSIDVGLTAGPEERSRSWRVSTPDDAAWGGNMTILDANVTEDELPWTGVTATLLTFVSYAEIGAGPGQQVKDLWMRSWADDDLRDVAPGGLPVPFTNGTVVVPDVPPVHESTRPVETLDLAGPVGYVSTAVDADGWDLDITIQNAFEEQGQHVVVAPVPTRGWEVEHEGRLVANLDGGQAARFALTARPTADAAAPLPIEVVTDVGGRERFFVGVQGGTDLVLGKDPAALAMEPPVPAPAETTPGPAGWTVAAAAVAAALLLARRRRG